MLARLALIACAFCIAQTAIAAEPAPTSDNLCRQQLPTIHEAWLHGAYDALPAASAAVVAAIDGKLPQLRHSLASLPTAEQPRWRQVAMLTAASAYQPAVVDGLLDDGATVDDQALLPPFKQAFAKQLSDTASHDPLFGGPNTIKALQAQDLVANRANAYGPALLVAAHCDDTATLDVLLRHHADVMARAAPNAADALTVAVVDGYAGIVQHLLDHGANVCADDQHIRKPGVTLASIGHRSRLPNALMQRLTCHAAATVAAP